MNRRLCALAASLLLAFQAFAPTAQAQTPDADPVVLKFSTEVDPENGTAV